MAYNIHYRISYPRHSGNTTTIDILDSSYGGGIVNLTPSGDPLQISFSGDINNIYQPTIGSGATLNVISTPLTLQGLFTNNPQQYIVKVYNGNSGSNLFWQGFVNTGVYSESYSISSTGNSPIIINCNDGMNVLDTLYYVQSDGSTKYTGISTIGTVLTNIFGKIGISFNNILTSNDLMLSDASTTNIFTKLKVNNENYFDENGIPLSCRDVLNSIFGGIGLSMQFKGSDIYLIDPINLHTPSKGKRYDTSTFTENSSTFGGYLDISNKDINWFQSGSVLDVVGMVSTPQVNYDPYTLTEIDYDFNSNLTYPGSWSYPTGYCYNNNPTFTNWTQTGSGHFIGLNDTSTGKAVFCLYMPNTQTDTVTYTTTYPTITSDASLSMTISFDSYGQTKVNSPNIYSSAAANNQFYAYYTEFSIMVGNQYWKDDHWASGKTGNYIQLLTTRDWTLSNSEYVADNTKSQVGDTWGTATKTIPLSSSLTGGPITLTLYDTYNDSQVIRKQFSPIYSFLYKNMKITFNDIVTGAQVTNIGNLIKATPILSSIYKNEDYVIKTTSGTGLYGTSRGTFGDVNSIRISGLCRSGSSTVYDTAKLILQSFTSQYMQPRFKLTGTLNVNNYLLLVGLKLIKDSTYQGSKAFYIVSGTYDDKYENMQVEMIELTSVRDTIS